ncbi:MAG: purine-nucleoside phosphorylase [Myxococcota bacterium]|nr:purine-nucleoside phosphorylase [Myxococcota bacterium]
MTRTPFEAASESAAFLASKLPAPRVAVVLGSGLGAFAERLEDAETIAYGDIPNFPSVSIVGHAGRLVIGRMPNSTVQIAALAGRVHLYEGHPIETVVHAVRTLKLWGVHGLLFTNAAGAIRAEATPGDLMLITDHINLTGRNPLCGHNDARIGVRFPDMSAAYDPTFCQAIRNAASSVQVSLSEGVYAGLLGPSYETPAEIRMLATMGADAVGMSTVCEVIAARHAGLRVAGISCLTNMAAGMGQTHLSHDEVKETANLSRDAFVRLLAQSLNNLDRLIEDA